MDKFDSFNVLPDEQYETAKILHQTGKSLGCKIVFKTRPNGYRVTFNKQSNRKALFWMEISDNSLLVKANLLHIDNYTEKISSCSNTIKKSITATKECENCHPCCGSLHVSYHIDGIKYTPCYFKGHYFSRMNKADWSMLNDLIVLENDAV
jgi:hypothetical protein